MSEEIGYDPDVVTLARRLGVPLPVDADDLRGHKRAKVHWHCFVHHSGIVGQPGLRNLITGETVEFDTEPDGERTRAVNVRVHPA